MAYLGKRRAFHFTCNWGNKNLRQTELALEPPKVESDEDSKRKKGMMGC